MSDFTGTRTLLRLAVRRERVRLTIWIAAIVGAVAAIAAALPELYPTALERASRAVFVDSPVARVFRGPGHGLDDYTLGAMLANEMLVWALLPTALMALLTVVRHTRAEEETERAELVRSSVAGRHAPLAAGLAVAAAARVAIGALSAGAVAIIDDAYGLAGAVAFGAALTACGLVFAAVGAVAAQVSTHSRGAAGIGVAVLGAAFVVRSVGDMIELGAISMLSPLGWSQGMRAFVDERWWPLLLAVGASLLLALLAIALVDRRDLGAGLMSTRPGPPRASTPLVRAFGLPVRLMRSSIAAWGAGAVVLGAGFGAAAGAVEGFLADNPDFQEALARVEGVDLLDTFLAVCVLLISIVAAAGAVQCALGARREELRGRADTVMVSGTGRVRWFASWIAPAGAGGLVILTAGAISLGLAASLSQGDASLIGSVLAGALVQVPALLVVLGLAALLFGALPQATALSWALVAWSAVVGLLGDVLSLPEALRWLSPFEHMPAIPGADPSVASPALALAAALVLTLAGVIAFRRRDLDAR